MDFTLDDQHRMLKDMIGSFSENELGSIAGKIDQEDSIPEEIWSRLGELGVMGINVPETYGGSGMDVLSSVITMEELSK